MLINNSEKKKIKSAKDIAEILQKILSTESEIDQDKEHFWSIGLTAGNNIKYIELVTLGILNASLAAPREVFGLAIQKRVCNIITAHNHPSGNINPSQEDNKTIRQMHDAGKLLEIPMLDHIIISKEGHWSAMEAGII